MLALGFGRAPFDPPFKFTLNVGDIHLSAILCRGCHHLGGYVSVLACMGPSMHKATEGAGVVVFSDPHTECAHSGSPCHASWCSHGTLCECMPMCAKHLACFTPLLGSWPMLTWAHHVCLVGHLGVGPYLLVQGWQECMPMCVQHLATAATTWVGMWVCWPSMYKAAKGGGGAAISNAHTGCAHSGSPCHTGATMAHCVGTCLSPCLVNGGRGGAPFGGGHWAHGHLWCRANSQPEIGPCGWPALVASPWRGHQAWPLVGCAP